MDSPRAPMGPVGSPPLWVSQNQPKVYKKAIPKESQKVIPKASQKYLARASAKAPIAHDTIIHLGFYYLVGMPRAADLVRGARPCNKNSI